MFQDITVEELLELQRKREIELIDVRSPSEYREATIPGSRNIPLFDDEERAEVGTLYKQESPKAAKAKGLDIVARKLPSFMHQFEEGADRKVVFCWRGGMRSRTTATLLSLYDIHAYRLTGGYRAYRKWVVETLASFDMKPECIVVNGLTGTGKTEILRELERRGYPVLDLEGMAGHRGSIFGQIGLEPSNQKTFESLLLERLIRYNDCRYVLIEAESKRVGRVVLPDFLVQKKEAGRQFYVDLPTQERIRNIIRDYKPEEHKEECLQAFEYIEKRLHTPVSREIREHLLGEQYAEAVALLLEHYYDPRYTHASERYTSEVETIRTETTEQAAEELVRRLPAPECP